PRLSRPTSWRWGIASLFPHPAQTGHHLGREELHAAIGFFERQLRHVEDRDELAAARLLLDESQLLETLLRISPDLQLREEMPGLAPVLAHLRRHLVVVLVALRSSELRTA